MMSPAILKTTLKSKEPEAESAAPSTRSRSYGGVQFNPNNRSRIFRATLFLRDTLRDKAQPDNDNVKFSMARDGSDFRGLAEDLALAQPALRGITGPALHSVYKNLVSVRRQLDAYLSYATAEPWEHTKMSDMALELREIDDDINERQGRKIARKDERIVQEETTDARVIGRAMGVRESKNKQGKKRSSDHFREAPDSRSSPGSRSSPARSLPSATVKTFQLADVAQIDKHVVLGKYRITVAVHVVDIYGVPHWERSKGKENRSSNHIQPGAH
ncbi:hypothetical protein BGZ65_004386 [Modicella reniformis]|uniref:Uncharacterized protein n=1 Tax=Modicella reniformis TaxID=1440133 RepID=A0A9P6INL0_9FUNG|nr:hypothetical protein BGZ65_004386 [Modicella reniformis]